MESEMYKSFLGQQTGPSYEEYLRREAMIQQAQQDEYMKYMKRMYSNDSLQNEIFKPHSKDKSHTQFKNYDNSLEIDRTSIVRENHYNNQYK